METGIRIERDSFPQEAALALRAVIFDYGRVLTNEQEPAAYASLLRISGLDRERFESLFWADRAAYDEGKLTGIGYWQQFLFKAGLPPSAAMTEELNHWDALMWTTANQGMLDWQLRLKQAGLLTAILSNIGDAVLASVEREFDWMDRFDQRVWSYQLGIAKPDPAIYLHLLAQLGTRAEESLFLDDKAENIQAALALGMQAIQFSTLPQLREDLIHTGLDRELPLPG